MAAPMRMPPIMTLPRTTSTAAVNTKARSFSGTEKPPHRLFSTIYSNSLSFYVDGQVQGSTAASQYWTAAPDCGQNGSVTITKDLGNSTALASTYEVIDDYGDLWWTGVINFEANTCTSIELTP